MDLSQKVLLMFPGWKRVLICIVPYAHLLARFAWLTFENNRLRALLYIELRKYNGQAKGLTKREVYEREI